jgi:hypothetical protein
MARRSIFLVGKERGGMIMFLILWIPLAVVGCAAFAALGIWAAITDEGHTAQRRRAAEMQAILVPAPRAADVDVMSEMAQEGQVTLASARQP